VTEEEEPNVEGDVVADLVADSAISTVKETSVMAYQACQANSACISAVRVQAFGACGNDGPCVITDNGCGLLYADLRLSLISRRFTFVACCFGSLSSYSLSRNGYGDDDDDDDDDDYDEERFGR